MEEGHFLIHMQKTGPKLAIFHVFFAHFWKNSDLSIFFEGAESKNVGVFP